MHALWTKVKFLSSESTLFRYGVFVSSLFGFCSAVAIMAQNRQKRWGTKKENCRNMSEATTTSKNKIGTRSCFFHFLQIQPPPEKNVSTIEFVFLLPIIDCWQDSNFESNDRVDGKQNGKSDWKHFFRWEGETLSRKKAAAAAATSRVRS